MYSLCIAVTRSAQRSALALVFLSMLFACDANRGCKFKPESIHWLQFRGPGSSGIAPEGSFPPLVFSSDTNILWKTEILPGWSSPCIVNDRIFLTGFDEIDSLLWTFAIDRENGELIWKDSVLPDLCYTMHPLNSYANPTIASNGRNIFASFPNYGIISYDLDGIKRWEYLHQPVPDFYGSACSPIVHDSIVILNIDCKEDPRIVALACETGDSIWTIRYGANEWDYIGSNSTPVIWRDILLVHASNYLIAYDLVTLGCKWWMPLPGNGVASPVIAGENLVLNTYLQLGEKKLRLPNTDYSYYLEEIDTNGNGILEQNEFRDDMIVFTRPEILDLPRSTVYFKDDFTYRYFDENGDKALNEDEWDSMMAMLKSFMQEHGMISIPLEGSGPRLFTEINWKVNEDTPETPSPLVVNEDVLFVKNGGIITVINLTSGETVFKDRIHASGGYLSSPLLAGNSIYICSYNGRVAVLSAKDYSVIAINNLKEKIGASPVAVDDVLYLRTDKHLYAFCGKTDAL